MAKKKKKVRMYLKPSASRLSFKLRGAITRGCRYAVVSWRAGGSQKRSLVSCHRDRSAAKKAAKKFRDTEGTIMKLSKLLPGWGGMSKERVAVYDLMNGKKVK